MFLLPCPALMKALTELTHQRLRLAILDGDLAPEDLVKLSPNDLATDEQKDARDAESKASTLERRADYYQIARAGIQVRCMLSELIACQY
jgi:Transcription factor S-II (TFIIS), central domain